MFALIYEQSFFMDLLYLLWYTLEKFPIDSYRLAIYLALGARIFYSLSYFQYLKSLAPQGTKIRELKIDKWTHYWLKEIMLIIIGSLFTFLAAFLLTYSLMISGKMLKEAAHNWKKKESEKLSNKITTLLDYFLGFLFNPIIPIIALISLYGSLIQGNVVILELIAVGIGLICYLLKRIPKDPIQSIEDFLKARKKALWHRENKKPLVALILIAIVLPLGIFIGAFTSNIYSGRKEIMLPMRDGVRLRTFVYFPPGWKGENDKRPVILCRTPYNAKDPNLITSMVSQYVSLASKKEYILVLQDLRGDHGSEGVFPVFESDNTDGVDTVNWIMQQSWCNGRIASVGGSAVCTNQYYYHAEGPEGMVAAELLVGTPELYDYWMFPGGCFRKGFSDWWLPAVTDQSAIEELLSHPMKDDYWQNASVGMNERYRNIKVRAVHIGGWYDCFQQGTLTGFDYYNHKATEYARGHQILIMGPWFHGTSPVHANITYPNGSGTEIINAAREFIFEEQLEGIEKDWTNQTRVYYYLMGDPDAEGSGEIFNIWKTAQDWPLKEATSEHWYFYPNGTVSPNMPNENNAANLSYIFDPTNPVQTLGGTTLLLSGVGAYDQRPILEGRKDILSFTSGILSQPVQIVGHINATLYIMSNCTDTDFTVKLMDVFPDGREMWVAAGILKARYRNGFTPEDVELMTPGQIYELTIDMWSTAYYFAPGHEIKITITSSDYPKFAVNPNTGGPVTPTFTSFNYANNTIIVGDPTHPSYIDFPVIKN